MKLKSKRLINAVLRNTISILLCSTVIVPLYMVFINSIKTRSEGNLMGMGLPSEWVWGNYKTVIEQGKLVLSFFNSCVYAFAGSIAVVFISALGTWVLERRSKERNAKWLYFLFLIGLFLPINYVTLIRIMSTLGLYGTRISMILYYIGANASFTIFVTYGYFSSIPREMDEAAIVDGLNPMHTFTIVVFPLLKPIIFTAFILTFMGIWSDFITPLYLINRTALWPMNLAIYNFFGRFYQQWNLVFADIILTIIPVFVLYILCQKYIISGLTAGSTKG